MCGDGGRLIFLNKEGAFFSFSSFHLSSVSFLFPAVLACGVRVCCVLLGCCKTVADQKYRYAIFTFFVYWLDLSSEVWFSVSSSQHNSNRFELIRDETLQSWLFGKVSWNIVIIKLKCTRLDFHNTDHYWQSFLQAISKKKKDVGDFWERIDLNVQNKTSVSFIIQVQKQNHFFKLWC